MANTNDKTPVYVKDGKIYTHDVAAMLLELFEDLLEEKDIDIPCADDDEESERCENDNSARLYGTEYSTVMEDAEDLIAGLLDAYAALPSPGYVTDEFSGNY